MLQKDNQFLTGRAALVAQVGYALAVTLRKLGATPRKIEVK